MTSLLLPLFLPLTGVVSALSLSQTLMKKLSMKVLLVTPKRVLSLNLIPKRVLSLNLETTVSLNPTGNRNTSSLGMALSHCENDIT